eukprot:jgi/Galph1/3776/GphlegSOOS_G2384.1
MAFAIFCLPATQFYRLGGSMSATSALRTLQRSLRPGRMQTLPKCKRPLRSLSIATRMRGGERQELARPSRALDSPFDELLSLAQDPWSMFRTPWSLQRSLGVDQWMPRVDLVEKEDGFYAYLEVPGMKREDIKVELKGDIITVSGEKKEEMKSDSEKDGVVYHRMERSYGSFQRSLRIPQQVEKNKIKAVCKDGILTVTMPKKQIEKHDTHTIEVSTE